jgi:predicted acetylornithine/succinylornithine family transaminase
MEQAQVNTRGVVDQFNQYVIGNYYRQPIVVTRAQGAYFWDADGKRYLDLFPSWGCSLLGHCHPRVVAAIQKQAAELIHMDNTFCSVPQGQLAELISKRSFGGKCFFANSGAEANEAAIKLARRATAEGKYKIITMEKSFHGRTYGAMSATAQAKTHIGYEPLVPGFVYVPFGDIDAVRKAVDAETAGIMVEPIQGEGGVRMPPPGYLAGLRELCDANKMILIFDEVQTGLGRTGKWFGYQQWDVVPDIMTLAKSLAGGAPMGAMVAKPEVAAKMTPGSHASTYGGSALIAAAAIAGIEAIEQENLLARAFELGEYIVAKATAFGQKTGVVRQVRGLGLMIGIELEIPTAPIAEAALKEGLRVNATQDVVLRLLPAMVTTNEQVDEAFEILTAIVAKQAQVATR